MFIGIYEWWFLTAFSLSSFSKLLTTPMYPFKASYHETIYIYVLPA